MIFDINFDLQYFDTFNLIKDEIKINLDNKRYFTALILLLIIPDICIKNLTNKNIKYTEWCERYIKKPLHNNVIEDKIYNPFYIYKIRNSLVHQGESDKIKEIEDLKIIIKVNDEKNLISSNYIMANDETRPGLIIDINIFYKMMIAGLDRFVEEEQPNLINPRFCVLDKQRVSEETIEEIRRYNEERDTVKDATDPPIDIEVQS